MAHFHCGKRTHTCLGNCCRIPGPEIAFPRRIDSGCTQGNLGICNATATLRQFRDHKPGPPRRSSFLADEWPRQIFLSDGTGAEASVSVAWTRRSFRRSGHFVEAFFLSLQHRNRSGQLGIGLGSRHNPKFCRAESHVARERVVNCVRLCRLASRVPHRFSLSHCSATSCSSAADPCSHHRPGDTGRC